MHKPLGDFLTAVSPTGADVIVPVPLTVGGLRRRGFNQSLLLAAGFSRHTAISLVLDGLVKTVDTLPQVGLTRKERRKNLKGAFEAKKSFSGMRVLLVDDVMTTGSTADECSRVLLRAGAEDVSVVTLARAKSD